MPWIQVEELCVKAGKGENHKRFFVIHPPHVLRWLSAAIQNAGKYLADFAKRKAISHSPVR
jgi:hypothetical protein